MPKTREAVWADAIAFLDDLKLWDTISVRIDDLLKVITHKQGDNAGDISFAYGREVKGEIVFNGIDVDLLNLMFGGTKTSGTKTQVRFGSESHTITFDGANHKITLAEGADVEVDSIELYDENLVHYKRLAAAPPGVGEFYHYNNGVLRFNTADNGKKVYPAYFYDNSGVGNTISIGRHDVSSQMDLWCMYRSKNLNEYAGSDEFSKRDIVVHLEKVYKTGPITLGAEDAENTKSWKFEFAAILDNKMEVYFPKHRIRTAILIVDYSGNNICDYNGNLIGRGYTEAWG